MHHFLLSAVLALAACQASKKSSKKADAPAASASEAAAGTSQAAQIGAGTSGQTATAATATVQPILDKFQACLGAGKVWLPAADASAANAAGQCGDQILPWTCVSGALAANIPGYAASLDKTLGDLQTGGLQVYAGSAPADGSLDLHLLGIVAGKLTYHKVNVSIEALAGTTTLFETSGDKSVCTTLFSSIVKSAPLTAPASNANFPAINALISANCGNGSCHGAGVTAQVALVDNESAVKAQAQAITAQLNSKAMPIGGTMSDADRQSLITLLQSY